MPHRDPSAQTTSKMSPAKRKTNAKDKCGKLAVGERNSQVPAAMMSWLYKQDSGGLKQWRRRWFVLSEFCLFYYKDETEKITLGSVLLPSYSVNPVTKEQDGIARKYAFKIEHHNMRTYLLAAEDPNTQRNWIECLRKVARMQLHSDYFRQTPDDIEAGFGFSTSSLSNGALPYQHFPHFPSQSATMTDYHDERYEPRHQNSKPVVRRNRETNYLTPAQYDIDRPLNNPYIDSYDSSNPAADISMQSMAHRPFKYYSEAPSFVAHNLGPIPRTTNPRVAYSADNLAMRRVQSEPPNRRSPRYQPVPYSQHSMPTEQSYQQQPPNHQQRPIRLRVDVHQQPNQPPDLSLVPHPSDSSGYDSGQQSFDHVSRHAHDPQNQRSFHQPADHIIPPGMQRIARHLPYQTAEPHLNKASQQQQPNLVSSTAGDPSSRLPPPAPQVPSRADRPGRSRYRDPPDLRNLQSRPQSADQFVAPDINDPTYSRIRNIQPQQPDTRSAMSLRQTANQQPPASPQYRLQQWRRKISQSSLHSATPSRSHDNSRVRADSNHRSFDDFGFDGKQDHPPLEQYNDQRMIFQHPGSSSSEISEDYTPTGPITYVRNESAQASIVRQSQSTDHLHALSPIASSPNRNNANDKDTVTIPYFANTENTQPNTSHVTKTSPGYFHSTPREVTEEIDDASDLGFHVPDVVVVQQAPKSPAPYWEKANHKSEISKSNGSSHLTPGSEMNLYSSEANSVERNAKSRATSGRLPPALAKRKRKNQRIQRSFSNPALSFKDNPLAIVPMIGEINRISSLSAPKRAFSEASLNRYGHIEDLRKYVVHYQNQVRPASVIGDSVHDSRAVQTYGKGSLKNEGRLQNQTMEMPSASKFSMLSTSDLFGKSVRVLAAIPLLNDAILTHHEELVLLLIRLRRELSQLEQAQAFYYNRISFATDRQNTLSNFASLDDKQIAENDRQLSRLRRQAHEINTKLEVQRPLVHLVDNLVKMGSLYEGTAPSQVFPNQHNEMIDFSRQIQEQRLVADHEAQLSRLERDDENLQERMDRLYQLDKIVHEFARHVRALQDDKDMLEQALDGLHSLQYERQHDPEELFHLTHQQRRIEQELSKVLRQLAEASKQLEEAVGENARLEHEIMMLRSHLHGLSRSASNPSVKSDGASYETKMKLQRDVMRVQAMMDSLQAEGGKLQQMMLNLRRNANQKQSNQPAPVSIARAQGTQHNNQIDADNLKQSRPTYQITNLDNMHSYNAAVPSNTNDTRPFPPAEVTDRLLENPPRIIERSYRANTVEPNFTIPDTREPEREQRRHTITSGSYNGLPSRQNGTHAFPLDHNQNLNDRSVPSTTMPSMVSHSVPVYDRQDLNINSNTRPPFSNAVKESYDNVPDVPENGTTADDERSVDSVFENEESNLHAVPASSVGKPSSQHQTQHYPKITPYEELEQHLESMQNEVASLGLLEAPSKDIPPHLRVTGPSADATINVDKYPVRRISAPISYPTVLPIDQAKSHPVISKNLEPKRTIDLVLKSPLSGPAEYKARKDFTLSEPRRSSLPPALLPKSQRNPTDKWTVNVERDTSDEYLDRNDSFQSLSSDGSQDFQRSHPIVRSKAQQRLMNRKDARVRSMTIDEADIKRWRAEVDAMTSERASSLDRLGPEFNEQTIDREVLFAPDKIDIPERYHPDSDDERNFPLSPDQLAFRRQKADRIRKLIASQSFQNFTPEELGDSTPNTEIHQSVQAEKQRREHILTLKQALADEISVKCRQVAESAVEK